MVEYLIRCLIAMADVKQMKILINSVHVIAQVSESVNIG